MIWYKPMGFYENYSWVTHKLQNYDVRRLNLLTIWMRLKWIQSILSPFSSTPKKRPYDPWTSAIFTKHNITWDTMLRRCREDDISRRTMWFARTRILQKAEKKHTFYPWTWWSRSRDMWFGRYRWSWRLNIWNQIFADHCGYIIFIREIDVKKRERYKRWGWSVIIFSQDTTGRLDGVWEKSSRSVPNTARYMISDIRSMQDDSQTTPTHHVGRGVKASRNPSE